MSNSSENLSPLTFGQWQMQQSYTDVTGVSDNGYIQYLKLWYKNKIQEPSNAKQITKQNFIQLLKDLNFLFGENEADLFIKDIDYSNQEDLVLAIPYFAKKLTEIAKTLNSKRESIKRAKNKFNLIGSNKGLESLLYDYILKSFTQRDGYAAEIPVAPLKSLFPELKDVSNDFFIEIEELHDPANYHDSDPSVNIKEYLDYTAIKDFFPLIDSTNPFTETDIINIISNRFLNRTGSSTLFTVFKSYLDSITTNPTLSSTTFEINNLIAANQKYLGETIYGVSALPIRQITTPDYILNLNFTAGNNWFLWPSGYQELNHNVYNNSYNPISIQDSSLINAGATPGTDFTNSDIIFSDKNGTVEGAWLQGPYQVPVKSNIHITLKGGDVTEFLYPYVGYDLDSKTLNFLNFNTSRNNEKLFNSLTTSQQQNILTQYYTNSFPLTSVLSTYLNQTNLIVQGATSGEFSNEADSIIKKIHDYTVPLIHSGEDAQTAYLYKFNRTDLPISAGQNNIYWPLQTFKTAENLTINYTERDCLPVRLADINPSYVMAGAVAGDSFSTSDVIYRLNSRSDLSQAMEAAWYGGGQISQLNVTTKSINIYGSMSAVDCAHSVKGIIQGAASFKADSNQKVSFVWCGEDTFADEVFKYIPHEKNCEYGKTYPHQYYNDQDFINPTPLYNKNYWTKCSCKAVYYSPIGHIGHNVTDYNGMADYLFADPFGLGVQFALGSWLDTRRLTIQNSPQFSFFQLDGKHGDNKVGYGSGRWKTSDNSLSPVGDRMILKTGKRYTYYRTGLRTNNNSTAGNTITNNFSPYFISNYIYPKVNAVMCDSAGMKYDIVIAIDYSRSQSFNFKEIKKAVAKICTRLINACDKTKSNYCFDRQNSVQVAVVGFAAKELIVHFLTNQDYEIDLQLQALQEPQQYPDWQTNYTPMLTVADKLLYGNWYGADSSFIDLTKLCSDVNTTILNASALTNALNTPQNGAIKKLVIISDGVSTIDPTESNESILQLVQNLKNKGTEIQSVSMGELSVASNLMQQMATSSDTYFNLYKYLISGDGNYDSFIDYISDRIDGCVSYRPIWRKAIKNAQGNWVETSQISDMALMPNDFLIYDHKTNTMYYDNFTGITFEQPSISFTINAKLDGWNYITNNFNSKNIGPEYGAKPFWAKVPNNPISFAGQVRFVDDYVPVHQPEISDLTLDQGSYIQYNRVGLTDLKWNQPSNFLATINTTQWNKIIFDKKYSNLESILRSNLTDCIINNSYEPSNMILESYSEYKLARYHYYAQTGFVYTENLFLKNRCLDNYVIFLSGVLINPPEPYANLDNRFYPTVATVSFPSLAVSEASVGGYLLPENLGVSTYRGRGYSYGINQNTLSAINLANEEPVFLDPEKYGSRNRGLTKKDQLSPVTLNGIDNKWIMEPYGSGAKSGVILNTKENQKFTPYQTDYEILGYNTHGLARQQDDFQFWKFDALDNATWKDKDSNSNYRKELLAGVYGDKVNKLLANKGTLVQWRSDIFGNDYGLYKQLPSEIIHIKIVPQPPVIVFQTTSALEVELEGTFVLTISAIGDQPFSYQWYHNNVPLYGAAFENYQVFKALPPTSGVYVCQVSNLVGVATSIPISVTFNPYNEGNYIEDEYHFDLAGDDLKPITWI
jgi:hypothetical protein